MAESADALGDPLGISVDSGVASFFDQSAIDWLAAVQNDDVQWSSIVAKLKSDLYARVGNGDEAANVVMFECGMGDGVYNVWLGLDANDEPVQVVIDLELLSHSLESGSEPVS